VLSVLVSNVAETSSGVGIVVRQIMQTSSSIAVASSADSRVIEGTTAEKAVALATRNLGSRLATILDLDRRFLPISDDFPGVRSRDDL